MQTFVVSLPYQTIDIDSIDFGNIDDVSGLASLILSKANDLGMFLINASRRSKEVVRLVGLAKRWLDSVTPRMISFSPGEALSLVDTYDFMYRIACRQHADKDYLDKIRLAAFEACIHGDKSVDEYALYRAIGRAIHFKEKAFLGRPLQWFCLSTERWYKKLKASNESSSDYDTIQQVAILLEADLYAYEGRNAETFKQQLFERHRHCLDNCSGIDRKRLCALRNLLYASARFLSAKELEDYSKFIDREIYGTSNYDQLLRKA